MQLIFYLLFLFILFLMNNNEMYLQNQICFKCRLIYLYKLRHINKQEVNYFNLRKSS